MTMTAYVGVVVIVINMVLVIKRGNAGGGLPLFP